MTEFMSAGSSLSELSAEKTIAQIADINKKAAELLASIGVSITENQQQTLRTVCNQRQWDEEEVMQWIKNQSENINEQLASVESLPDENESLEKWNRYLKEHFIEPNVSLLKEIEERFSGARESGSEYHLMSGVQRSFDRLKESIRLYYGFENKKLFPLVSRLQKSKRANIKHGIVKSLRRSFEIVKQDQDRLQRLMNNIDRKVKKLRNGEEAGPMVLMQVKNINMLFSNLRTQFQKEHNYFIPRLQEEIKFKK